MKRKSHPLHEPAESEIQHAAYRLWIEQGRPEGRDIEHWFIARKLLLHRHAPTNTPARQPQLRRAVALSTPGATGHVWRQPVPRS